MPALRVCLANQPTTFAHPPLLSGHAQCPRCAKMIPSEDFEEHLRIELLDPKWRAQQEHKKEREAASLLVEEEAIAANLKAMAERRRVLRGEAAPPAATSTDDPSAAGGGGLASSLLRAPPGMAACVVFGRCVRCRLSNLGRLCVCVCVGGFPPCLPYPVRSPSSPARCHR